MKINKIYCEDCLETMARMEPRSINLIIGDPPYFEVKGKFDFIWKSFDDYLKDVEKWTVGCKRILADNGTLLWYGNSKKIAYSQIIFDKYFNLENNLVWRKIDSIQYQYYSANFARTFNTHNERILMYSNDTDRIIISKIRDYLLEEFKKSKKNISYYKKLCGFVGNQPYNWFAPNNKGNGTWQMPTEENYKKLQTTGFFQKSYNDLRYEYEQLRRPFYNPNKYEEVLEFSQQSNKTKYFDHETQKPEELTRALILTCSLPNDVIYIPFVGSGTECAMAIKEGRRFIGSEINSKYIDIAEKRIKQEQSKLKLNLEV